MMGIKWVGGVALAYMALAYIRDALPKDTVHKLAHPGTGYGVAAVAILGVGLVLAGIHIAGERRKSRLAHLSKPMKLASILPSVFGTLMLVTWWQMPRTTVISEASAMGEGAASDLRWESNESAAVQRVSTERKPLLVDFGASWCGACKELEEKTFPDPRVRAQGARFIALHVDATDDDDPEVARVRQKYGAKEGLPVLVAFGTDGREAFRFTEFVSPDRLATALASVQ
jgi:thiol:disulfide interchange protein DsbD